MGISSSKNREEANVNRDLNLQINFSVPCPISAEFFYSNIQTLAKCTDSLRGFSADSASPSDIYALTMTGSRGSRGVRAIMKLFIVNDPLSFSRNINVRVNSLLRPIYPDTRVANLNFAVTENLRRPVATYEAQVYELVVYLEKIKKLLDYNICPYFVKPLGGNVNTSALEIWQYLLQPKGVRLHSFIKNLLIMRFSLIYNLNPNRIDGLYVQTEDRPAITTNTENTVVKMNLQQRELTSPEIRRLYAGSRPVDGYRYSLNQEIQYDISSINEDYLSNIQCGYILTEQEEGMKLSGLLLTVKAMDYRIRGTTLHDLLHRLHNSVRDSRGDIMDIFGRIDSIMAEERNLFAQTKIGENIRNILNLVNRRNRTEALESITRLSEFSSTRNGNRILRSLIFQILIACYAMFLSGVAHNDLHIGNVFVNETDKQICYFIEGQKYVFRARFMPKLYDFDRSYVQGYNNTLLVDNNTSQNNALLNPKDFAKILCYIRRLNINDSINTYIQLSVNSDNIRERERLFNDFYNDDDGCFLRHRTSTGGLRDSSRQTDFNIFHNYRDLIHIFGAAAHNTGADIPDEWLRTHTFYFLQENFFRNNKLVSADIIDAEILKYGKAGSTRPLSL